MSPLEGFALMVSVLGGREYSRVTASERDKEGWAGLCFSRDAQGRSQ